jgi:hypothetical protein
MEKVLVYCVVQWDSEGESLKDCDLPNSCVIEVDKKELKKVESNHDEIHALVCRALDEKYGFQVHNCEYRVLNTTKHEALRQLLFFLHALKDDVDQPDFNDALMVLAQTCNDLLKSERAGV